MAGLAYHYYMLDSGESFDLLIHGIQDFEWVVFSASISYWSESGNPASGIVDMTQTRVLRHVDGTIGHILHVTNVGTDLTTVDISVAVESY